MMLGCFGVTDIISSLKVSDNGKNNVRCGNLLCPYMLRWNPLIKKPVYGFPELMNTIHSIPCALISDIQILRFMWF